MANNTRIQYTGTILSYQSHSPANYISSLAADDWFDNILCVFQDAVNEGRCLNQKMIKVAILDTGIDRNDIAIRHAMATLSGVSGGTKNNATPCPAISERNCRGFPKTLDPLEDKNGHGTCCAALLLRTAPNVELFIGRVVGDDKKLDRENDYNETVKVSLMLNQ